VAASAVAVDRRTTGSAHLLVQKRRSQFRRRHEPRARRSRATAELI